MTVAHRDHRIDAIRGVSILLVLFHHFVIAYRLDDTTLAAILGWDAIRAVARNGNYGVTMFFVVSGFLITTNARRRWGALEHVQARSFYAMRIARILPCLVLLLLTVDALALANIRIFQNAAIPGAPAQHVPYWLSNLAALTAWMNVLVGQAGWFNYPLCVLWSLSVEEAFYFAFPLACLLLRRPARLAAFWAVFIVAGAIWRSTHQAAEADWLYADLACFDAIAIGCCTALLTDRISLPKSPAAMLDATALTAMTALYLTQPIAQTKILGPTLMAIGTACLLLKTSSPSRTPAPPQPGTSLVRWFGRLSYELYLFHLVALGTLRTLCPPQTVTGDTKLLLLAIFLATSALLAASIATTYATPLNHHLRRLLAPPSKPQQNPVQPQ